MRGFISRGAIPLERALIQKIQFRKIWLTQKNF
jgi:hypothetical protein